MHPLVKKFLERPNSHKAAFIVGNVVLLFALVWFLFYSSRLTTSSDLDQKISDLESKIGQEKRLAANLPKVKKAVQALDVKLKQALQELPDRREIPDLIESISGLARDAGLEVVSFKPETEVYRDFYSEVPVSMVVDGTFHQVATFFDEVGHLPRIVNISRISISEPTVTPERVKIKVACKMTTFRFLDEAERAKIEKARNTKSK
ncbi:MAG TPA: type 4a pilus biogenesis protein PilO [Oligoflexia bacterium]|nr:type 4a pilus biogenesis protein PilO [Oligoflexia bacterium]HMP27418.1 type 4a pilus biogenesis protein PilO [Oligoflexia bacterium]